VRRLFAALASVALAAALAKAGADLLFSTFMSYDDEGYVLRSLWEFARGGGLYDEVYTQYGPFPYLFWTLISKLLGIAWTHESTRWATLAVWLGTAGIVGRIAGRQEGPWSGLTSASLTFLFLWTMIREPGHPGGLLALLVACAVLIASHREMVAPRAIVVGALIAAAFLTKINVGVFLGASVALLIWVDLAPTPRRLLAPAAMACLLLLPPALMAGRIHEAWAAVFAGITAFSSIGVFLLLLREEAGDGAGSRRALGLALGFFGMCVAIGSLVLATGTSITGLLEGTLLGPLRHPGVYTFPYEWKPGALPWAGICAGLFVLSVFHTEASWGRVGVAIVRVAFGVAMLLSAVEWIPLSLPSLTYSYGLAAAPLLAIRLRTETDVSARVRRRVALVFTLQVLHAYPVAGSQLNWGGFLFVPLLVLSLPGAVSTLAPRLNRSMQWVLAASGLVGILIAPIKLLPLGMTNRAVGVELALPGSGHLIAPEGMGHALKAVASNARANGGTLFTLPGLFSLNFWSDCPTPSRANATHWFTLLSVAQQDEIARALEADPKAMLVVQKDLLRFLVESGFPPRGPLAERLPGLFEPAFEVDAYAVWVRRGQRIEPVDLGMRAPGQPVVRVRPSTAAASPTRIELRRLSGAGSVPAGEAGRIEAVGEWVTFELPPEQADDTLLVARALDSAGSPLWSVRIVTQP
jgi:hypothetical protein